MSSDAGTPPPAEETDVSRAGKSQEASSTDSGRRKHSPYALIAFSLAIIVLIYVRFFAALLRLPVPSSEFLYVVAIPVVFALALASLLQRGRDSYLGLMGYTLLVMGICFARWRPFPFLPGFAIVILMVATIVAAGAVVLYHIRHIQYGTGRSAAVIARRSAKAGVVIGASTLAVCVSGFFVFPIAFYVCPFLVPLGLTSAVTSYSMDSGHRSQIRFGLALLLMSPILYLMWLISVSDRDMIPRMVFVLVSLLLLAALWHITLKKESRPSPV